MLNRPGKFIAVGACGFVVQIATLWILTAIAGWSWLPATIAAVELTIVHNYLWHQRWTWSDRDGQSRALTPIARFVRFNAAAAVTSIAANVAVMALFVDGWGIPVVMANTIAVGGISAVNFLLADRWVFSAAVVIAMAPASAFAAPSGPALEAWRTYVAQTERQLADRPLAVAAAAPDGRTIDIASGTISHWSGSVLVRGTTVDQVLHRLQYPGTPPPQEDVTASRVLGRGPDSLRVFIRLVRHAVVTVTYDTEHEMTFSRVSPALATARSVATRIDEVGGGDKGFLWRLNSYWRYAQTPDGVLVSLESLTLSRDVPFLIKPLAGSIVPRIARDSVLRTLDAVKRYLES
jgi:putative flippase GtrA